MTNIVNINIFRIFTLKCRAMKWKPVIVFLLLIGLSLTTLKAQDIHFSQFFSAPLYTNPANTGNFQGDYRFVLNNKNQWLSFTNAYRTIAGSVDASFSDLFVEKSIAGLGLIINNDIAGDGHLGTNQFYLSGAFSYPLLKKYDLRMGFGFNAGYVMHGINFNNFYFGEQYSGEQYDESLPSGESWTFDRLNYADVGLGVNFLFTQDTLYKINLGLSVSHITTPGKSFNENSDSYLPVKWSINLEGEYHIKDDFYVEPMFLGLFQQKYTEINVGVLGRLDYNPVSLQSIYFGTILRARDAGIICFGFKYHNAKFMINYDINLSGLSTISRGKGGVEFSLIYIFLKPRPFEAPDYRKCPDFI